MRPVLRALLNFLGIAGTIVSFFIGTGGAAVCVSRLRIINEDFCWIFLVGGLLVGLISLGLLIRKKKPEPPAGYLLLMGLFLLAGAVPTLAALLNVKLDRSPPRKHWVTVIYAEQRNEQDYCAVNSDALGAFWVSVPSDGSVRKGSYIEVTTRSGLLGFDWIERVGPEPRPPVSFPTRPYSAPPTPPPFDPKTTPLEAPDPEHGRSP